MKIGLLSDTHNDLTATRKAAQLLLDSGVDTVLHCGDLDSSLVIDELYSLFWEKSVPLHLVWGNCDLHVPSVLNYPELDGLQLHGRFGALELGGQKIGFMHGDDQRAFQHHAESGQLDYLITGHTHKPHDQLHQTTRLLNPGSAAQSRNGPETVATLDLPTAAFTLLQV